jgi:hypothetical protein
MILSALVTLVLGTVGWLFAGVLFFQESRTRHWPTRQVAMFMVFVCIGSSACMATALKVLIGTV